MKTWNIWLVTVIVLVGLLVGCGAGGSQDLAFAPAEPAFDEAPAEEAFEGDFADESAPIARDSGDEGSYSRGSVDLLLSNVVERQQNQVIIYTGNLSLRVTDPRAASEEITVLAQEKGGYVSAANIYASGDTTRGSITIKVPSDVYQETLADLRRLAVLVINENSSTEDVTAEFSDLQAQKANLEVTETALQELLTERQNRGSIEDILAVFRELTTVRDQIERIEGRLRFLAERAALSTITIDLQPDILAQPVAPAGWQPSAVAREALQTLVVALQGLANIAIWLVIVWIPILALIFIPFYILVRVVIWQLRRWRRNKPKPPTPQSPASAPKSEAPHPTAESEQ